MRDARKEERERVERENKKREAYNAKLEEAFERDKKNRELAAAKGDEAAMKEKQVERHIQSELVKNETVFSSKIAIKEA